MKIVGYFVTFLVFFIKLIKGQECPENCICDESNICVECKIANLYGENCTKICPANCKESGEHYCDFTTGYCESCSGNFKGNKCSECINHFKLPNCDVCEDHWDGELCDTCKKHFKGTDCDECEEHFTGTDCNSCIPHFKEPNCDVCEDHWDGDLCDTCKKHFKGPDCDICEEHFTGTDCNSCIPHFKEPDCKICEEHWDGDLCNKCKNHFKEPNCDICEDHWDGELCDKCKNHFKEPDCIECEDHWEGELCDKCKNHFKLPDCDVCEEHWDGELCDKCKPHFKEPDCSICEEHFTGTDCNSCIPHFKEPDCDVCVNDYFGPECDKECGANCNTSSIPCDMKTGKCSSCLNGFLGDRCNNCKEFTDETLTECSKCYDGFYLNNEKECIKCESKCKLCSSKDICLECKEKNMYTETCDKECPKNCLDGETEHLCDFSTGKCNLGCQLGFFGEECKKECGEHCIVTDTNCERDTGKCTQGCDTGFQGDRCDNCEVFEDASLTICSSCFEGYYLSDNKCLPCSSSCKSCNEPDKCLECKDRDRYGETCDLPCADGCIDNPLSTHICSFIDGNCTDGCKEGKYGANCTVTPPDNCTKFNGTSLLCEECEIGYYLDNNKCIQCSANCTDEGCSINGCINCKGLDQYGDWCELECEKTCLNQTEKQICARDGKCTACPDRKYGDHCTEDFPKNCSKFDTEHLTCLECDSTFYLSDDNKTCIQCSENCKEKLCEAKGVCVKCDNWNSYGDLCNLTCPDTCLDVSSKEQYNCGRQSGVCTECPEGYYGPNCTVKPPEHCEDFDSVTLKCKSCDVPFILNEKDNVCDCPIECKDNKCTAYQCDECAFDNKYGNWCDEECPDNCKKDTATTCYRNGTCIACPDRFYTPNCSKEYPKHCTVFNETSELCSQCEETYYVLHDETGCDECSESCQDKKCTYDGCEKCLDKEKYGDWCNYQCPDNCDYMQGEERLCQKKLGNCYKCKPGFTSTKCEEECSDKERCIQCDQKQASKCLECQDNFFLNQSNLCQDCSSHCKSQPCNKKTGECTICEDFYWGKECFNKCFEGCNQTNCGKESGVCKICHLGYYGERCENKCGTGCKECEHIGGKCKECNEGYYLDETTSTCIECGEQCVDSKCTKDGCLQCKNDTLYGKWCDQPCPKDCIITEGQRQCDQKSGTCEKCKDNKYGPQCNETCSNNCISLNPEDVTTCNFDGSCKHCRAGTYGEYNCTETCPENCKTEDPSNPNEIVCDRTSGICTNCMFNYFGDLCEDKCSPECLPQEKFACYRNGSCAACINKEKYGPDCALCSEKCLFDGVHDNKCDYYGNCFKCQEGYRKEKCDQTCDDNCDLKQGNCKQDTGECTCKSQYYWLGTKCTLCNSENTTRNCKGDCSEKDGCESCEKGFYTKWCDKECPFTFCSECQKDTGECISCGNHKFGIKCENTCNTCEDGCTIIGLCLENRCNKDYYNIDKCLDKCTCPGKNEQNGLTCDNFNGNCLSCPSGKYGQNCDKECSKECLSKNDTECCEMFRDDLQNNLNLTLVDSKYLKMIINGKPYKILVDFNSLYPLSIPAKTTPDKCNFFSKNYDHHDSKTFTNESQTNKIFSESYFYDEKIYLLGDYNFETIQVTNYSTIDNITKEDNITINNIHFLLVYSCNVSLQSVSNGEEEKPDGIIGLGYLSQFSMDLKKNLNIDKNIMTKVGNSSIVFGTYPPILKTNYEKMGLVSFINTETNLYETTLDGFAVDFYTIYNYNAKVIFDFSREDNELVFTNNGNIDNFFKNIFLNKNIFISEKYKVKDKTNGRYQLNYTRVNLNKTSFIGLVKNSFIFYFDFDDLFRKSKNEPDFYETTFLFDNSTEDKIILGKKFLNKYNIVFNHGKGTMYLEGEYMIHKLNRVKYQEFPEDQELDFPWYSKQVSPLVIGLHLISTAIIFMYIGNLYHNRERKPGENMEIIIDEDD